jgi:hypothetical protein
MFNGLQCNVKKDSNISQPSERRSPSALNQVFIKGYHYLGLEREIRHGNCLSAAILFQMSTKNTPIIIWNTNWNHLSNETDLYNNSIWGMSNSGGKKRAFFHHFYIQAVNHSLPPSVQSIINGGKIFFFTLFVWKKANLPLHLIKLEFLISSSGSLVLLHAW